MINCITQKFFPTHWNLSFLFIYKGTPTLDIRISGKNHELYIVQFLFYPDYNIFIFHKAYQGESPIFLYSHSPRTQLILEKTRPPDINVSTFSQFLRHRPLFLSQISRPPINNVTRRQKNAWKRLKTPLTTGNFTDDHARLVLVAHRERPRHRWNEQIKRGPTTEAIKRGF